MSFKSIRCALHKMRHRLRLLRRAPGSLAVTSSNVVQLRADFEGLRQQLLELNRDLKLELSTQLGFSMHDVVQLLEARSGKIGLLESILSELKNIVVHNISLLDTRTFELTNKITHLETSLHSRLNTLENNTLPDLLLEVHNAASIQLSARASQASRANWVAPTEDAYERADVTPFDTYLRRASGDFPSVYQAWEERLRTMSSAFEETMSGNAANPGDIFSRMFRSFVQKEVHGRVLDVGCGVFGRPFYLDFYPASLISGIDPLTQSKPADFDLVRGISEYLPWPDRSFSTVISATSLDHCLSLDRSISEMLRVIRQDGILLLWIGSNPGSPKYDPQAPDFHPSDKFHLFHFDEAWFDPYLMSRAHLVEKMEFKRPDFSHIFYSLRPKAVV